ncbi:MAG: sugar phosphate nucleotidyltransferase [Gemmatimonadales bacterium]
MILAAGVGSRMRRDADDELAEGQRIMAALGIKAMIPDARGRPLLDHILSALADAGIRDVCLVVGPSHGLIREHYAIVPPHRVTLAFVVQDQPRGTADAVLAAETWIAGRDFLVLNADNLYPVDAIRALVRLARPGLIAFDRDALIANSNIEAARVASFATLMLRDDGTLAEINEKPERDVSGERWISMNLWRFDAGIFAPCRAVLPSSRGELELPQAVSLALHHGLRLEAVRMSHGVLDLSSRADIAEVTRRLGDVEILL